MQIELFDIFFVLVLLTCLCAIGYVGFALFAVKKFKHKRHLLDEPGEFQAPVSILKPIYGLDAEMAENLRSFCQQVYPEFQIIFGFHDKNDPAIAIVKKIIEEFDKLDLEIVIDSRLHGANHKVSNLINMQPRIKHDYVIVSDSDMRVPSNYLANVMSPFEDPEIGGVTCLYSGSARGKIASTLNAMFINEWFLPSVLISRILNPLNYCMGATMAVRKSLLDNVGDFKSLANHLADDYMLGNHIVEQGYKIHLSDLIVENIVEESSIKSLGIHELRWARTLRTVEPLRFSFTFITDTFVISFITAYTIYAATHHLLIAITPVLIACFLRMLLHKNVKEIIDDQHAGTVWHIPLRDLLTFFIRIFSFTGNSIQWRNNSFNVDQAGLMHIEEELSGLEPADNVPDLATTQDF